MLFSSDVDAATLTDVMRLVEKEKDRGKGSSRGKNKVNLMDTSNDNDDDNNDRKSCPNQSRPGSNVYLAVPTNLEGKLYLPPCVCYIIHLTT